MRIRRIDVSNFRSLRASSLNFTDSTALIGENNSGKSAFLLALDLFFASSPRINDKDFSDRNTNDPIDITVHFAELNRQNHCSLKTVPYTIKPGNKFIVLNLNVR